MKFFFCFYATPNSFLKAWNKSHLTRFFKFFFINWWLNYFHKLTFFCSSILFMCVYVVSISICCLQVFTKLNFICFYQKKKKPLLLLIAISKNSLIFSKKKKTFLNWAVAKCYKFCKLFFTDWFQETQILNLGFFSFFQLFCVGYIVIKLVINWKLVTANINR